jgi:endonuclease/exonuclease/phosphatase family metal-dependent hydrolase
MLPRAAFFWIFLSALTSAQAVRIATYNVENYNCAHRLVDGIYRQDYPKPEVAKAALRAEIREVNADVLALQEIGGEAYLRELQLDLRSEGLDYPHAIVLNGPDPDRKLAFLSKNPWTRLIERNQLFFDYFGKKIPVKRGLLGVVFNDEMGEWAIFTIHLKGKFTDNPEDTLSQTRRLLEARRIRDEIVLLYPPSTGGRIFVVGDFNDDPKSKPVQAFLKLGKVPIGTLLPTTDSHGERWTHIYHGKDSYSRVDYIVISPLMEKDIKKGVPRILDRQDMLSPRWKQPTDHRLVFVDWIPSAESP